VTIWEYDVKEIRFSEWSKAKEDLNEPWSWRLGTDQVLKRDRWKRHDHSCFQKAGRLCWCSLL